MAAGSNSRMSPYQRGRGFHFPDREHRHVTDRPAQNLHVGQEDLDAEVA
jgi:hypothetical protein